MFCHIYKKIKHFLLSTEGPPITSLIHVFTPFFGRIHVFTHVEVPFSRSRTSCCSLLDLIVRWARYAMTAGYCPMQLGVWGRCKPPSRSRADRALVGIELRKSSILRYKIQPKNTTSWFSFLVQNEFLKKSSI